VNTLVRIPRDDDGYLKDDGDVWHLVDPENHQGASALCTGEFFGAGESACEFEIKEVSRGGITCPRCVSILKGYKAVKL
jgi:hypothetical protein